MGDFKPWTEDSVEQTYEEDGAAPLKWSYNTLLEEYESLKAKLPAVEVKESIRNPVQISVDGKYLYALMSDGTIWRCDDSLPMDEIEWVRLPEIKQKEDLNGAER